MIEGVILEKYFLGIFLHKFSGEKVLLLCLGDKGGDFEKTVFLIFLKIIIMLSTSYSVTRYCWSHCHPKRVNQFHVLVARCTLVRN